jgi:hypothetical protein
MPQRLGRRGIAFPPKPSARAALWETNPVEVWLHATAQAWTQRGTLGPPLASESPANANAALAVHVVSPTGVARTAHRHVHQPAGMSAFVRNGGRLTTPR